jgi:flagellar basal body-associated protein FliL
MNRKGDQGAVAWRTATRANDAELSERSAPDQTAQPSAPSSPKRRRGARAEGDRRGRIPVAAAVKKIWIVLVVVVVVLVAGFCVTRLRSVFGNHDNRPITSGNANDIKPFNPKHVVYEVYGPPGTIANINYLDINAQPQKASNVPLPWTLSVITTLPSVSVNIVAQANTDQIGCRIIVNDVVKDERSANGMNAQTFCIVKSG